MLTCLSHLKTHIIIYFSKMIDKKVNLKRIVVMEVFGGCNYTCQMCPQTNPGRGSKVSPENCP